MSAISNTSRFFRQAVQTLYSRATLFGVISLLSITGFARGGEVGGGGNAIEPKKVSVTEVRVAMEYNLRFPVYLFFSALSIEHEKMKKNGQIYEPYRKLFDSTDNIFTRLIPLFKSVGVLVKGPCLSANGHEDGSFYYDMNHSPKICISAKTLSEKLNADNLRSQILGLMIHELGHALGLNEDEAKSLQKLAIRNTKDLLGFDSDLDDATVLMDEKLSKLMRPFLNADPDLPIDGIPGLCAWMERVGNEHFKSAHEDIFIFNKVRKQHLLLSGLNFSQVQLYHEILTRLYNLNQISCAIDRRVSEDTRAERLKKYHEIVGSNGASSQSFWHALDLYQFVNFPTYPDYFPLLNPRLDVIRLDSREKIQAEWSRLLELSNNALKIISSDDLEIPGGFPVIDR